jgi:hypothetical protein
MTNYLINVLKLMLVSLTRKEELVNPGGTATFLAYGTNYVKTKENG